MSLSDDVTDEEIIKVMYAAHNPGHDCYELARRLEQRNARWDKLRKAIEWAIGSKHEALAKILLEEMNELTGTAPEEEK